MNFISKDFVCATEAGLSLTGQDEYGTPQWIGSAKQFRRWGELMDWVDACGTYPWVVEKAPF